MAMAWFLLDSGPGDPAFNMAMDEASLLSMPRLHTPVLHFYSWTQPAASFGYFQKYGEVERMTHLRPLVRRPTGGGLVPHDTDWTYSLALPVKHSWYHLRATESYRRIHEWVAAAFRRGGIEAELAPAARVAGAGQCFVGYEQSDVLWNGLKIAGAAQRRTRDGLLIQGSIQLGPIKLNREEWQANIVSAAPDFLDGSPETFEPDRPLLEKVEQLMRDKYQHDHFHRRR
jgi:lipoate-protein ligase A